MPPLERRNSTGSSSARRSNPPFRWITRADWVLPLGRYNDISSVLSQAKHRITKFLPAARMTSLYEGSVSGADVWIAAFLPLDLP